MQLMFYATQIAYSAARVPENFQWVAKINPVTYIIEGYRAIFYEGTTPDLPALLVIFLIGLFLCITGYIFFSHMQKGFAEEF